MTSIMRKSVVAVIAVSIGALAWSASEIPAAPMLHAMPAGTSGLIIPVAGVERSQIRDTFNEGRVGHMHEAIDILATRGTPVLAAVDGTVRKLFTSHLGGLTIYEFDGSETHSYYYAHLDRYAAGVVEGKEIHRGEVIGYVGSTGNAQTPHLHFAVSDLPPGKEWWKGTAINPYDELVRNGITMRLTERVGAP